ncbi:phosphatase PAP2 family protein [Rhizobium tubonense]|uniref:Phosphatase n=1 Tax=Rhizobium tubonense TaxID=484088 RepID=A0A2W4CUZ6_9HYPH|nr:phosphatase PAP2 family protein [Rhizobium tubonense]PZM16192.1 phosphatase [Rhizobium tubonense]
MQIYAGSLTRSMWISKALASFLTLFALWWVLLIIFNRFPELDLAAARSVFSQRDCGVLDAISKTCGAFQLDKNPFFMAARTVFLALPYIAIAILLGLIVMSRRRLGKDWKTPEVKMSLAALVSLAMGCGVLVNLILKSFSGRPRPRNTLLFGGNLDFVQAGSFAGKCLKNCSFISGEASSAGWLFCLILLLPARWRLPVGLPLAVISISIPTLRVLTGAHYLSDAVLGWLSSLVIFAGVLVVAETMRQPREVA